MAARNRPEIFDLLTKRQDAQQLLTFFQELSEGLSSAFANSARTVPAVASDRSAVSARGNLRRMLLDRAFRAAAASAGFKIDTGVTVPPTWSYPLARIGGFSLTIGIVDRQYVEAQLRLRNRGRYVRELSARNTPLDPQSSFFDEAPSEVAVMTPSGAFGALVVVEPSMRVPDSPMYVGFWIPSPNLKRAYYRCTLEFLIRELRAKVGAGKTIKRVALVRKKPKLRKQYRKR